MLPVAGVDWLVVVCDLEVAEGDDCVFWADGVELCEDGVEEDADGADEFELFGLCAAGGELFLGCSLGDCAYAPAPSIKPMAVVINKRSLMFHSLCWCWPKDVKLTLAANALFQIAAGISSW